MKILLSYSLLLTTFLLYAGCKSNGEHILSDKIGPWTNIYQGDKSLAGVQIYQYPESDPITEKWCNSYENKHPSVIWYFFWNGRAKEYGYEPSGKVSYSDWYSSNFLAGDMIWDNVNFSYGSDPTFKNHADPRLPQKSGPWINIYRNDPTLAGVCIYQYPDSDNTVKSIKWRRAYVKRHPWEIRYVFWNGNARRIEYDPNGKVLDDRSDSQLKLSPESPFWNEVDFSYGSDPSFKKHKDPRPKNHS